MMVSLTALIPHKEEEALPAYSGGKMGMEMLPGGAGPIQLSQAKGTHDTDHPPRAAALQSAPQALSGSAGHTVLRFM